jgi:hypothetical protein
LQDFATEILRREARIAANRRLIGLLSRGADTPALRRERLVVKADTVLRQVELLSLLWDEADEKAGFRPDQPRHPRGSGPIGGRWSGGAGTIIIEPAGGPPTRGHHYVPKSLIKKMNLTTKARELLLGATTGDMERGVHLYDEPHRRYSDAVERHIERFLRESGIGTRAMTADEAQRLLRSVWRSNNPDIWKFNRRLAWSNRRIRAYRLVKLILRFIFRRGR